MIHILIASEISKAHNEKRGVEEFNHTWVLLKARGIEGSTE